MRIQLGNRAARAGMLAVAAVIGVALMLATVVNAPGASAQLPPIPQTLNGLTAEITVDGDPYDDTTPIEVLDQSGTVLGTADIANGVWVFRVSEGPSETVIRIGLAVTDPIPFAAGVLTSVVISARSPSFVAATTTVSLNAGFQALTHVGGGMSVDDFLALFDSGEAIAGVFVWDRGVQNWTSWRRGLPPALQGVTQIGQSTAMLLLLDAAVTYESEVLAHDAGTHSLDAGFTAVPFLGPDGTSLADGMAAIAGGAGINSIFRFNKGTGLYDSFLAALPPALNSLTEFNRGDVLLVQSGAATTWPYDAFTP